jgi:putative solute:sodium symporter small subunit
MEASSFRPFGYPLSYYMTCQGSLLVKIIRSSLRGFAYGSRRK